MLRVPKLLLDGRILYVSILKFNVVIANSVNDKLQCLMWEIIIIYIFFILEKDLENSDKTNDNVQKLLALSESAQISSCSKSNIINHTNKSKRHYEPKSRNFLKNLKRSKPKKESSLFTEEDFDRFSKEYFLNSEPINKSSLDKMKQKEIED